MFFAGMPHVVTLKVFWEHNISIGSSTNVELLKRTRIPPNVRNVELHPQRAQQRRTHCCEPKQLCFTQAPFCTSMFHIYSHSMS